MLTPFGKRGTLQDLLNSYLRKGKVRHRVAVGETTLSNAHVRDGLKHLCEGIMHACACLRPCMTCNTGTADQNAVQWQQAFTKQVDPYSQVHRAIHGAVLHNRAGQS